MPYSRRLAQCTAHGHMICAIFSRRLWRLASGKQRAATAAPGRPLHLRAKVCACMHRMMMYVILRVWVTSALSVAPASAVRRCAMRSGMRTVCISLCGATVLTYAYPSVRGDGRCGDVVKQEKRKPLIIRSQRHNKKRPLYLNKRTTPFKLIFARPSGGRCRGGAKQEHCANFSCVE